MAGNHWRGEWIGDQQVHVGEGGRNAVILLQLLWSFTKIGFTSFGGLSMIPLISSEMQVHQWMTAEEVSDIVAIAEMTPGPLGLNCATFAGMRTAGLPGAIAANLGVLMPTLTVCALAALFFQRFRNSPVMRRVMVGVRPACVGMVAGVMVSLSGTNYMENSALHLPSVGIGVLALVLLLKFKVSIPKVIGLCALLGLICFGIF